LQLLPNPYRQENYFNGGTVYEIPSGKDQFALEVEPPFGEERIFVYGSSSPLGDLNLREAGRVYQVKTESRDIGAKTRGVKIRLNEPGKPPAASEFYEESHSVLTRE